MTGVNNKKTRQGNAGLKLSFLGLLFRTEASDRRITVPITGNLEVSLRSILAMHLEKDDAPQF